MMTTIRTMESRPTATRVTEVADALLAKYLPKGPPLERVGLDPDDVQRLTRSMKREHFIPSVHGREAMTEFLDAGFKDMTKHDYRRWGLSRNDAQGWSLANKHRLVVGRAKCYGLTTTVYNWK